MSTPKEKRPKRPIVKPSRYQTTSSDEAPSKKIANNEGEQRNITASLEADFRELRGILRENSSLSYNNNNTNLQTLHNTHIDKAQAQTSTHNQTQYQTEQIPNPHPSVLTNIEPHNTLSYPITPITQHIPVTACSSAFTSNDTFLNNTYNKFQVSYSNRGERYIEESRQTENVTEYSKIQDRLDHIETELKKLNNTVERILKCVQTKQDRRQALQKPKCLPLSTEQDMQMFEMIAEDTYEEVVDYLRYVGGFSVKEAVNLSFKEVINDSLMTAYTWFGHEQGPQPLYKTRIIMAIYGMILWPYYF